jgi:transcription antitermination protein NusB
MACDGRGGRGRLGAGVGRDVGRVAEPVRDHPIMTRRSRGREVALQVLYQVEQNVGMPQMEVRRFIQRRLLGDRKLCEFTEGLIAGVKEHQARIDTLISEAAENWRLDRMAAIDRNILRLGAYEMMFCQEVPARVAINEALELAKRYSTAQSSRFVNGILDRLLQSQIATSRPGREPESATSEPDAVATESGPESDPPAVTTDETPAE